MKVFYFTLLIAIFSLFSCVKIDDSFFNLNGEFALLKGTCTPYCIINISKDILILEGIDYSGSSKIVYVENYRRSSSDPNKYELFNIPSSFIIAKSEVNFTFTSSTRTCEFGK